MIAGPSPDAIAVGGGLSPVLRRSMILVGKLVHDAIEKGY
jgi:hypothetical protein